MDASARMFGTIQVCGVRMIKGAQNAQGRASIARLSRGRSDLIPAQYVSMRSVRREALNKYDSWVCTWVHPLIDRSHLLDRRTLLLETVPPYFSYYSCASHG